MDLISLTLGRVMPRHRTLREWVEIYLPLLEARQMTTGKPPCPESMSWRFEQSREDALGVETGEHRPPSLHECRSLAAREYRKQGINTQDLLGHSKQAMTELYHDDRGLDAREGKWRVVALPLPPL